MFALVVVAAPSQLTSSARIASNKTINYFTLYFMLKVNHSFDSIRRSANEIHRCRGRSPVAQRRADIQSFTLKPKQIVLQAAYAIHMQKNTASFLFRSVQPFPGPTEWAQTALIIILITGAEWLVQTVPARARSRLHTHRREENSFRNKKIEQSKFIPGYLQKLFIALTTA